MASIHASVFIKYFDSYSVQPYNPKIADYCSTQLIHVYTYINYSAHQFWWNCTLWLGSCIFRSPHALSGSHTINCAMLCYLSVLCLPKISNCLSQHSSSCDVACFVTATYALALSCALLCLSITLSCSLMCLALSQHHAALALSCALLCLSITLLLSHVPCFVSASRCCSLMCLALSQHHAAHVPCLVSACHTALFSALPCPGYSIAQLHTHVKQSCPMSMVVKY